LYFIPGREVTKDQVLTKEKPQEETTYVVADVESKAFLRLVDICLVDNMPVKYKRL
jgi:hypothetical protein